MVHSSAEVSVGDIEGDIPMHAESLHEVVMRNASKLNEQINRLEEDDISVMISSSHLTLLAFSISLVTEGI